MGMLKKFILTKRPSTLAKPIYQTKLVEPKVVNKVRKISRGSIGEDSNYARKVHAIEEQEVLSIAQR